MMPQKSKMSVEKYYEVKVKCVWFYTEVYRFWIVNVVQPKIYL